ncbi:MAG: YdiU family protein [Limisphaerales bacterium]
MLESTAASPIPSLDAGWRLEHSYALLPASLHRKVAPTPVREPRLVLFNRPLARDLGLDPDLLDRPESNALFAGNALPPGAEPLAQAYAGHQYGHFTTLGDGRAILLGEQRTPDGGRFDVQLKGPGMTPFSRRGDGRAALGPMLREYVISEFMHAAGIPTTRSLAVATTGEPVFREQTLRGAVLTRIAASHIRVGTFEWAAALGDGETLTALADHTLHRHFPDCAGAGNPVLAMLEVAVERQASLIARWLLVGFIHGVMNTDNMALSGETIDYGPCAFMDEYDPATVFSSIDRNGRYAYGNQARIAQWNLARLAEALLPLIHPDEPQAVELAGRAVGAFPGAFHRHWLSGMRSKLGLLTTEEGDSSLVDTLLAWMHRRNLDFTNTFRSLTRGSLPEASCEQDSEFMEWHRLWTARLTRQSATRDQARDLMLRHNPAVIPRNHKVEEALNAASLDDLGPLERLLEVLGNPWNPPAGSCDFTSPPRPGERVEKTFCGT